VAFTQRLNVTNAVHGIVTRSRDTGCNPDGTGGALCTCSDVQRVQTLNVHAILFVRASTYTVPAVVSTTGVEYADGSQRIDVGVPALDSGAGMPVTPAAGSLKLVSHSARRCSGVVVSVEGVHGVVHRRDEQDVVHAKSPRLSRSG